MSFSTHYGYKPFQEIQDGDMDESLKNSIWNCINVCFFSRIDEYDLKVVRLFFQRVWINFLKQPYDELENCNFKSLKNNLKTKFYKLEWYEVYDFVEYLIAEPADREIERKEYHGSTFVFCKRVNKILKNEKSAFRVVGNKVVKITDENEIQEVEEAANSLDAWKSVSEHVRKATSLLSDRKNPDYVNVVKESITAVESACCIVTRQENATLGKMLKKIEKEQQIHKAVLEAFKKLYGYTSDEDGIRHGGTKITTVDFDFAKYMLVTCCAFVNYLKTLDSRP